MKREPRGKFDRTKLVCRGTYKLTRAQHAKVLRMTEIADNECFINFRWGLSQLAIVRQAAELIGVPYQDYIKQVLYRQAHADLRQFGVISPEHNKQQSPRSKS